MPLAGRPAAMAPAQPSVYQRVEYAPILVAVAVVLLLMAPFYGPLLDHHFAERLPHHVHVYAGNGPGDHTHGFEQVGHAHPVSSSQPAPVPEADPPAPNVAFLLPLSGHGPGGPLLVTMPAVLAHAQLPLGTLHAVTPPAFQDLVPPQVPVLPPDKPPTAG